MYQQRNEVHNNCGIEIYYQTDMQSTSENMFLELFCQIISEPCFNTLRTKEQLGEWAAGHSRTPHSLRNSCYPQEHPPHVQPPVMMPVGAPLLEDKQLLSPGQ